MLSKPARTRRRRPGRARPRSVFRTSIAIVIGPTPPGTGVIRPALSTADSKCTSPTSPCSVRLMPTSITVAPGLIQSPRTISGRPTAAISTSARRQTSGRSRVREWQIVTVACCGQQQRGDRFADEVGAADDDRLGAHKRNVVAAEQFDHAGWSARPQSRKPLREPAGRDGRQTVDVLARIDQRRQIRAVDVVRGRQLQQDSGDPLVRPELRQQLLDLGRRRRRRQLMREPFDPHLRARLLLAGDVDRGRRIVADENCRQSRRRTAGRTPCNDLLAHLSAHFLGDCLAIDQGRCHRP